MRPRLLIVMAIAGCLLAGSGCRPSVPAGALVMTQTPAGQPPRAPAGNDLDTRYPIGSRVVMAVPPFQLESVRVLSAGLAAAGDPMVSPDGRHVFFTGKADTNASWQIYEARLRGGRPRAVTSMPGGAMNPAVLGNGDLVFCSPVPNAANARAHPRPAAVYVQSGSDPARQLTFGVQPATDPTVLNDGRILFVSARRKPLEPEPARRFNTENALYTVNNDGTQITAFALDRDGAPWVRRPRQLPDGRVAFIAFAANPDGIGGQAEGVRMAAPFATRTNLFAFPTSACASVEAGGEGSLLACLETRGLTGRSMRGTVAVFRIAAGVEGPGEPLFDDPAWNDLEATPLAARPRPQGHISTMVAGEKTGTILCLDANFFRGEPRDEAAPRKAARVRVLAAPDGQAIGELPVQADGSFLVEVPADTAFGFETLDEQGDVIHRLRPALWVRPGENRSCIGCHEPYNHSPRNVRPLAANFPPATLQAPSVPLAQHQP